MKLTTEENLFLKIGQMKLEEFIISTIKSQKLTASEVRSKAVENGFKESEARSAIFYLWNDGFIDVDLDQKLVIVK